MNPSRETNFSGAYRDREIFIFSIQLTTSRIGNLTRLIYSLLCVMTIHKYTHTYIHTHTHTPSDVRFFANPASGLLGRKLSE